MSVPAAAEAGGWQSARVRALPRTAWAYSLAVMACAAAAAAVALATSAAPSAVEWEQFLLLAPLAAIAPLLSVSIGRNHSFHSGPTFVVAGALVLPPVLLIALVVLAHLPEWVRQRYPWYIQTFNIANYVLGALAAFAVADAIGRGSDLATAGGGLAAAAVFTVANHVLLATMLRLGRGHSFRASGLFSLIGLGTDLVLAGLGIAVAAFVLWNPWLLPALLAPLALAHRSLSVQALLRESEERFRTMFESAPTAIMIFGLDGRITAVNRSAEAMWGYTEAEMVGRRPSEFRHPDDAHDGDGAFQSLLRGDADVYRREGRFVTKGGQTLIARLANALVRDADLKPSYLIGMGENVTEQHELEERLRQSQKLEAIGRLAGGVAHDFNNMLTAIGGYNAFALERAPEGTPLHSDLQEVRKATERATILTRQLLAFSRKQILQPELLNLNAVVLELQSMLRPLIGEDIVLTTDLDPALGPIEADPGQLQQVVMNLVVNARDAMPAGGAVSIETANAEVGDDDPSIEPGRYVTLTVRDSGHGIDADTLEQIFEPFFTTKEIGKGTGLGLATVYGIVKQSGGYVVVESEIGAGTAFTIFLRRNSGTRLPQPEREPDLAVEAGVQSGETVLLVEDEEVVRRIVRQVLEGAGYRVLEASDGSAAVELGSEHRIDLLLTDMVMPKLGGNEVAEQLRRATPGLKVIYMSGYADGGLLDNGTLPPGTELLQKPFAFADLLERVRRMLDDA